MPHVKSITPCLWFEDQAEQAAQYYTGIFKGSKIGAITRYGEAGQEFHKRPPGSVLTVSFELAGHGFTALNAGPASKFNEAISFQVNCETQQDVDYYWEKLGAGGDPKARQCGWLKDKYGVSWQIVPTIVHEIFKNPDSAGYGRAMLAMMEMKKLDIAELKRAFAG